MSDTPSAPPKVIAAPPVASAVRQPVNAPIKTAFDAAPAGTLAARQAAGRARVNLQAAVRAVMNAQAAVAALSVLVNDDAAAAAIAAHEGVGPDQVKKFTKLAEPFVLAFTSPPTA